ncbi:MAG: S8 family serine peptidase, partial [Prolixibacteraceae bacterium]|nr:S8 family serine peptidase [Prolixibacteraceae bacterium]
MYKLMDGDSVSHTRIELPDSLKRYIIEFTEPALYAQTVNSNLKSAQLLEEKLQTIDRQHEQFEHDLNQMFNRGNGNLKSQSTEKKVLSQSYRKVFNGVAIQVNSMVIEELKRKPYVKKVYSDKLVQAIDDESNQVIKADSVRQQYGVTGKGVVIGIIDTGIDYNHPDLSNGKVIGGYDFVNEDDDPMDDHGHGTHCAGIAAANGPGLTGVAPDAKLMAVKVLDEWGNGWDSDIIAGIEYAVDPDGNPATDDGADIISMSLGGSGNPDDPMSAAVDNAFNKGVLSIVAAGNNGAFFSIGSPGCAKEALTVGASDNIGERAFFSSAGPVMMSYALKPNVLAPGVDIYSSVPGGNYESWNGTSMATPHVAGAAALLKEFHLSWDAKMLRSSIIHTAAYNSEYLVWHQGNGCVDLMKAAQCVSFVSKSSCDFGIIPIEEEMVSLKDSFFVKNQYQTNLNYHVQYNREPPFGLARNILPSTFTLAPGDSQLVVITLQIENSKLAFSDNAVKSYSGEILIDDAIQPLSIHYTFIKSYYVKLTFDFDPWLVLIHDGKSFSKEFFPDSRTYIVLVDSGLYDVLSFDTECYIVKENVPVYESVNLNFSRSEANNRVKIEGIDPYGQPVKLWDNGAEMLYRKSTNTRLAVSTFKMRYWDGKTDMPVYKYFSDFSDKYRFEVAPTVHQEANPERKRYNIPYLINNGLYGDTILVNQSDNFVTMNFTYHNIDESNDSVYYDDEDYNGGYGLVYIFNNFNVLDNVLTSPYRRVAYYVPSPDRDYRVCSRFGNCLFKYNGNGILDPWTDTLLFKSTDQNRCFWDNGKIKLVTSEDGFEKEVGKFIDIDFNMSPKICKSPINLDFNQYANTLYKRDKHFSGSDFGIVPAPFKVELFKENQLVSTDSLMNDIYTYYNEKFIIPYDAYTNYKLRIESPMYSIQGKVGRSYATFYYNRNEYIYTSDLLPRLLNFGLES